MDKAALREKRKELQREIKKIELELNQSVPGHRFFCNCTECGGCLQSGCDNPGSYDTGYCQSHSCPHCSYVGELVSPGWHHNWCCPKCAKQIAENEKGSW